MSAVDLRQRLMAPCYPSSADYENCKNHVDKGDVYHGATSCCRTDAKRHLARRDVRTSPRGKSAVRRAAISPGSRCADETSSGSDAINEANLLVDAFSGNRANSAASCQASISNRASAERTLSGKSFLSSPIAANRKSSNSDPRTEPEAELVISTTKLNDNGTSSSAVASIEPNNIAWRRFHVRLGNYLLGLANSCFNASNPLPNLSRSPGCIAC